MENIVLRLQEWVTFYGLKILAAIAIFLIGRWIAKAVQGIIKKLLAKRKVD
ncbi:MAG: hypothetical protein KAJ52_01605, partial [Sedimentisphaerales bacterium]|nr:hypothetical protein [Sedimentisphaerales bacterium]